MAFSAKDVIPLSQARARLSELADEVKPGAEKLITKNGERHVALIDTARLDHYHLLERERIHLIFIDEAEQVLAEVRAGRTANARETLRGLRRKSGR